MRSAPCDRARSRHAAKACRLAWISAKMASNTISSAPILSARPVSGLMDIKLHGDGGAQSVDGRDSLREELALTRRLKAPKQQRQQGVDSRLELWVAPFLGMCGMVEVVVGGGHERPRGGVLGL